MASCRRMIKAFLDLHIMFIVLLVSVLSYLGIFPIDKQGFYCNDETIRYQFRGDTISMSTLVVVTLGVPVIVILLVEFWRHSVSTEENCLLSTVSSVDPKTSPSSQRQSLFNPAAWFTSYLRCSVNVYSCFFHGVVCLFALVEFLKIAVGELRPHFLDTCKPDYLKENCSDKYITEYTCMGSAPVYRLMDSYKSFPSGHAAASVFMSLFLCVYIRKQVFPHPTYLSSSMLQVIFVFWAVYCSMSRIVDRRHHWWDVTAGFLIGVVLACYSCLNWLKTSSLCEWPLRITHAKTARSSLPDYGSCVVTGGQLSITRLNRIPSETSIAMADQQLSAEVLQTISNHAKERPTQVFD